jgi:hypothetical protein
VVGRASEIYADKIMQDDDTVQHNTTRRDEQQPTTTFPPPRFGSSGHALGSCLLVPAVHNPESGSQLRVFVTMPKEHRKA